jgi:hypothetical protein
VGGRQGRLDYPVPVLAAAILAAEGVSFVLVGSAALWLHGEPIPVADADVVIDPAEENLHRLGDALAEFALRHQELPRVRALPWLNVLRVVTSYGIVDCLLERGRLDWQKVCQSAVGIPVADVHVPVAARADVWDLRHRFKE